MQNIYRSMNETNAIEETVIETLENECVLRVSWRMYEYLRATQDSPREQVVKVMKTQVFLSVIYRMYAYLRAKQSPSKRTRCQSVEITCVFEGPMQNVCIFATKTAPRRRKGGQGVSPKTTCGRGKGRVNLPQKRVLETSTGSTDFKCFRAQEMAPGGHQTCDFKRFRAQVAKWPQEATRGLILSDFDPRPPNCPRRPPEVLF